MFDNLDIAKALMDQVKFYINPQIYSAEKNMEDPNTVDYSRRNVVFEEQSQYGQATGELISPKFVRKAIKEFYEDEEALEEIEQTVVEMHDGKLVEFPAVGAPDEDVLG